MQKKIITCFMTLFISAVLSAQPSDPAKDWSIGLQLWTFRVFTFHDAVSKADSCGIKVIQAFPGQALGGSWKGGFGPAMSEEDRKSVREYLKSKGMTINAFGVTDANNEEGWKKLFDFAKEMGIPILVAEPRDNQWNYVDRLAGEYHIRVAIHDHPKPAHYWSPDSVVAAMKGHPNIGSCADIGHWARNGLNVVECLKKLEGHIWNVHLKDVKTFGKVNADDAIPGQGVIDMPAVFRELKRQGYKGNFAIEHEANWENNAGDVIQIVHYYHELVSSLK